MSAASDLQKPPADAGAFVTTRWSVILAARNDREAGSALATLCQAYWFPLYTYVRRQGHSETDAQDLTQEFFARLLAKNYLADVDRERGRFRSFLLAALKHFLANEWDKARAQKRGGGHEAIPLDTSSAETRFGINPAHNLTPDREFDRRWAMELLNHVLASVRAEYAADGKAPLFEALKDTLTGERTASSYAEIAIQLGTSEGAIKVAAHRLRHRYRDTLRAEIAHTVATEAEVDDELRQLFAALAG